MPAPPTEKLKLFLEPESVTLVGVSTRTGPGTFNILEELIDYGYQGRLYPVNPKGGEILGVKTYTSVAELPEVPDLAVISTPRQVVPSVVKDCVAKGIKAVTIITQGFTDADDEDGQRMHREILDAIAGSETRIVGPNTLGVINNYKRFSTSFVSFDSPCRDVGVICQSGIFIAASGDFTGGIGLAVDIGNTADLESSDVLEYLGSDDRIKVINLHIEGLRDGRRFMEVAAQVSSKKPVLALKTGTSDAGARAASSHSGSLAGEDRVYSAAFSQAGIIRVRDVDEMRDLTETFLTYKSMPGKRVAIITISGGAGIIAVDAVGNNGLEVATFSNQTMTTLKNLFPGWMEPGNPTDIWPAGMAKGYKKVLQTTMETILTDPGVDAVLLITPAYTAPEKDPLNIIDLIDEVAATHPEKPTTAWIFGPHRNSYANLLREREHIVAYPTADRAMRALAKLHDYLNNEHSPIHRVTPVPDNIQKELAGGIIESNLMHGTGTINEQALDIMRCYGIPVVETAAATSREEAIKKAGQMGYPVVMKVISPQITHKSDIGGVKLNLTCAEEVASAWEEIKNAVAKVPGAQMIGVIVQPQRTGGTEVILGAKQDPQFGPVILFGLGGIYTELWRDVSFRVAPVSLPEARKMIEETRAYQILRGLRGKKAADVDAIADSLVRLGFLIYNHPEIAEMDINPMLVNETGAVALDGRIMLQQQ